MRVPGWLWFRLNTGDLSAPGCRPLLRCTVWPAGPEIGNGPRPACGPLWGGKTSRAPYDRRCCEDMLELFWLLFATVLAWVRPCQDLVLENLLLRHQLAVLTRPTRARPRGRLRAWDKLLWVLARRCCAGWREHLAMVTPETVVRLWGGKT